MNCDPLALPSNSWTHQSCHAWAGRWTLNYQRLPPHHQAILRSQQAKIEAAGKCIEANQAFITTMLAAFDEEDNGPQHLLRANAAADEAVAAGHSVTPAEADKVWEVLSVWGMPWELPSNVHHDPPENILQVCYVLKNLARDWSAEGADERAKCYGPILAELRRL